MLRRTVLAVALVTVGCTSATQWAYEKRGATPAQIDRDLVRCRKEAFRPQKFAIFTADRYDYDVLNRCMERRGYEVRPVEP